jgi:hypothetical protein
LWLPESCPIFCDKTSKLERTRKFSDQKRYIFLPELGRPEKPVGNDGIHAFTLAESTDFATTLPELFAAMCSNRENEGEHIGVKRLNRFI